RAGRVPIREPWVRAWAKGRDRDTQGRVAVGVRSPAFEIAAPRSVYRAVTLHTAFPTSSATSSAPRASTATPTGRPIASPPSRTKPVRTSTGAPDGLPFVNGTKITL